MMFLSEYYSYVVLAWPYNIKLLIEVMLSDEIICSLFSINSQEGSFLIDEHLDGFAFHGHLSGFSFMPSSFYYLHHSMTNTCLHISFRLGRHVLLILMVEVICERTVCREVLDFR